MGYSKNKMIEFEDDLKLYSQQDRERVEIEKNRRKEELCHAKSDNMLG